MNPLIVALDTDDLERLSELAAALGPGTGLLKVGLQAYVGSGPRAVEAARAHAPVFADLKLHDIPNTVGRAAAAAADLGVAMLTVHASGGPQMIAAAAKAAPDVAVLAVTVLTSLDDGTLLQVGQRPAEEQVPRLAAMAVEAGAAGVVCAPAEVPLVRAAVGAGVRIVTPGIRPGRSRAEGFGPGGSGPGGSGPEGSGANGSGGDDQVRTGRPRETLEAGADYLVVGRPVTAAPDPAAALAALRAELDR